MSTSNSATVYNATDGPLTIDRAGRVLGAREHSEDAVDVDAQPVKGHLAAGRLVVPSSTDTATPEA